MKVTVIKRLNGVEIHPAEGETPMSVIATYAIEVPELGVFDHKSLDLVPHLTDAMKTQLENGLNQARQVIDAL